MISWRIRRELALELSLAVPQYVDGISDPKADLPLSSESRQKQSLAGVKYSTLPLLGAQGGLLGVVWGVRFLVCDPCSCCGDSCSNLAAWPNKETLST